MGYNPIILIFLMFLNMNNGIPWLKSQTQPTIFETSVDRRSHRNMLLLFSCSVMSNSLQPHGLQHSTLACPSPTPGDCSNSSPSSQWCHPTISSSVIPSPPAFSPSQHQGLFLMSQFFSSGGEADGASASALVLPMNVQDWCPLGLTGLISLQSKGLSGVFSSPPSQKASVLQCSAFFMVQLSSPIHDYWKTIALTIGILLAKWCLCFLPYYLGLS